LPQPFFTIAKIANEPKANKASRLANESKAMGNKALLGIVLGGGILAWLSFGRKAKAQGLGGIMQDRQLGPNFWASEFQPKYPTIQEFSNHLLTPVEMRNEQLWVTGIGQPVRNQFGIVTITNGGRPPNAKTLIAYPITDLSGKVVILPVGSTIDDMLRLKGYGASYHSDHDDYSGFDFVVQGLDYNGHVIVYNFIKTLPQTRQVILYQHSDGKTGHIHAAIITPDKPRIADPNFAFYDNEAESAPH
jgi:hypothetical protein